MSYWLQSFDFRRVVLLSSFHGVWIFLIRVLALLVVVECAFGVLPRGLYRPSLLSAFLWFRCAGNRALGFPLGVSSVGVANSAVSCGFDHIV